MKNHNLMRLKLIKITLKTFSFKKKNSKNKLILTILAQGGMINNNLFKSLIKLFKMNRIIVKKLKFINNKVFKMIINHQK